MLISERQRTTIGKLRVYLAEMGYRVFPVAPWYRRDESDFVAISNDGIMKHLFIVRAVPNGTVSVRPFSSSMRSSTIAEFVGTMNERFGTCASVWSKRFLPKTQFEGNPSWFPYLDEDSCREWLALA
jgi:hypothetical protein